MFAHASSFNQPLTSWDVAPGWACTIDTTTFLGTASLSNENKAAIDAAFSKSFWWGRSCSSFGGYAQSISNPTKCEVCTGDNGSILVRYMVVMLTAVVLVQDHPRVCSTGH